MMNKFWCNFKHWLSIAYYKTYNGMNKLRYPLYLLFSAVLFYSCTLVTEPDRIDNKKAAPPELINYNFQKLAQGQHVDGTIKITFAPKDLNNQNVKIKVYIDSLYFGYISYLPHTLEINTRKYSEGSHNIFFYVYQKENNLGLLNFLDAPAKIYGANLYFDRTSPDLVYLSVKVEDNGTRDLTWTPSNSSNFYAYIIYKSFANLSYVPIDTIYNRNNVSLKDSTNSDLLGVKFEYMVAVTTDFRFTFQTVSSPVKCVLGRPISYEFKEYNSGPYLNENLSRLYYIADNKLIEFSSSDLSNIGELDLNGLMLNPSNHILFKFNFNKSRIYLYNPIGYKLWIINSSDLSIIKKLTLPDGGDNLYVLDNSRIFFSSNNSYIIISTENNSILNKTNNIYVLPYPAVVTQDSVKMVFQDHNTNTWRLDMMDIRSSSFEIMFSVNTNNPYNTIKKAGNKLYCDAQDIYDANNLNLLKTLNINENFESYAVTDGIIVIDGFSNYNLPGNQFVSCQKISVYNDNSNKLMQFFVNTNNTIVVDKENVYTGPSKNGTGQANVLGYSIKYGQ